MIPLKDNLSNGFRPWGVLAISVILSTTSLIVWSRSQDSQIKIFSLFGFVPIELATDPWFAFLKTISASFLHGDIFHLVGNCYFLWVFGRSLERLFGTLIFLLLFPFLGVTGFLLQWITEPNSFVPVIGASAGISTMLGAYFALFPNAKIKTLLTLGWFFRIFDSPAWIFLIYWIFLQIISLAYGPEKHSSIAYAAHLGGFILGVISSIIWKVSYPEAEERLLAFTNCIS